MKAANKQNKPTARWGKGPSKKPKYIESRFEPTTHSGKNYSNIIGVTIGIFVAIIIGFILFKK